ncbi:hypothetical protein ACFSQ7_44875 [Paenibacillus rhizoplanae]
MLPLSLLKIRAFNSTSVSMIVLGGGADEYFTADLLLSDPGDGGSRS